MKRCLVSEPYKGSPVLQALYNSMKDRIHRLYLKFTHQVDPATYVAPKFCVVCGHAIAHDLEGADFHPETGSPMLFKHIVYCPNGDMVGGTDDYSIHHHYYVWYWQPNDRYPGDIDDELLPFLRPEV